MTDPEKTSDIKQQKTVIKLLIYSVDDIFNDFDLRNISTRSISEDFISEVVHMAKNYYGETPISIKLVAPRDAIGSQLTQEIQVITRERIKSYFRNKYIELHWRRRKKIIQGWTYIIAGIICFCIFKYASLHEIKNLFANVVFDLISFMSWFSTWNGFDTLNDLLPKTEVQIYKRLAEAGIYFNLKR
ncbi:MAG: hypothetical protein MUC95_01735 [Spirochaetes bacterium]|jgi:hypothetical protein|nr:hypothetical protein [Spirochaetota bacterium]